MRPPLEMPWDSIKSQLMDAFGYTEQEVNAYTSLDTDKEALMKLYKAMTLARGFENACNQQYMQGKIRGFMHLDNGQEAVPGLVDYAIKRAENKSDKNVKSEIIAIRFRLAAQRRNQTPSLDSPPTLLLFPCYPGWPPCRESFSHRQCEVQTMVPHASERLADVERGI